MDADADALYALPAAEFTAARDALAKRLRADGRREAAAEVKGLRRPTAPAAALNRAVRRHPEALAEFLAAGRTLTRAQERLLGGQGDRAVLREAAEHVREAAGALTELAASCERLSPALRERVRGTLQAALVDPEVRGRVEQGRLEREADAPGGLFGTAPAEAMATGDEPPAPRPTAAELRRARAEAQDRLDRATEAVTACEARLAAAGRRAEEADRHVEDLRARLTEAEKQARAAGADADALRAELRRLKGEAAAAQSAVDAAG